MAKYGRNAKLHSDVLSNRLCQFMGYTTLFQQILFRQTLFRQSTVGTSGGWLQLNRPTGSTDWKDIEPNKKIRGSGQYNCVGASEVRCNFSGGGAPQTPPGYPPQASLPSVTSVPRSMTCFRCDASTSSNFLQMSTNYICLSAPLARDTSSG